MDLTPYFKQRVEKDQKFKEVLEIVKTNVKSGNIWIIGGIVYRSIINELYKSKSDENFDFDFILEDPIDSKKIKVPEGWQITKTNLDCPRLIKGKTQIDFIPLADISAKKRFGWDATIDNYFRQVPLTIQAIVFDIQKDKVLGNLGVDAILNKEIKINNLNECRNFCKNRKISIRKFIKTKAKSLNFNPIYPNNFEDNLALNETIKFYDTSKLKYQNNRIEDYESFTENHLSFEVKSFLESLKGKRILDLGSGPGRDSLYFKSKGFEPVCADLSVEMVNLCKEKGLKAYQKNMEDLDFEDNYFDGVWAYASLVHLPKFSIFNVLARINEILKQDGLLFLGMLEGEGEVLYESKNKSKSKRLFSLYKEEELRKILLDYFEIINFSRFNVGDKQSYLNYTCRKK